MPATLTLRLKVRSESHPWLNAAAREVNTVWNWCNATSIDAADRNRRARARCGNRCQLRYGSTIFGNDDRLTGLCYKVHQFEAFRFELGGGDVHDVWLQRP